MLYQIIQTTTYCKHGMRITHEKTLTVTATVEDVIALAQRQGADIDEVQNDLEYMGYTHIKGYMIFEM